MQESEMTKLSPTFPKLKEIWRKKHLLKRTQKLMEKRNPSLKKTSPQEKQPMNLLEEYREMERQALIDLVNLIDEYVPRSQESGKPQPELPSSGPTEDGSPESNLNDPPIQRS